MELDQKKLGLGLIILAIFLFVIVSIVKVDLDERDVFLCEAVHSNPNLNMNQCPAHQSDLSWLFIMLYAVGVVILVAGTYLYWVPVKRKQIVNVSKLNKDEKNVYDVLKKNEGSIYQSELMKKLNISKVQMTRILDGLEGKKIIERKRRGMTNVVILN